jgi:hypothetical protein
METLRRAQDYPDLLSSDCRSARISQLRLRKKVMRTLSFVGLLFVIWSFITDRNQPIAYTTTLFVVQVIWMNLLQTESEFRLLIAIERLINETNVAK